MNEQQLTELFKKLNGSEFEERLEAYDILINLPPEHSELSEDGEYSLVPIAYLEPDLRKIFSHGLQITIKSQQEMFGAICTTIQLKVFHPVYKSWFKYDGTAAMIIEVISAGKYEGSTNVVMKDIKTAIAIGYSEAVKNAAKKIGPRFGADLNRKRTPARAKAEKAKDQATHESERILHLINDAESIPELNKLIDQIPTNEEFQKAFSNKLKSLKNQKNDKL